MILFLKKSFKGHALGGLFEDFSSIGLEKKVYIGVSLFFFVYQIFQNVKQCIQYFANLKYIHESIFKLKNYLDLTIENMKNFTNISKNFKCYKLFNNNLNNHCNFLESFKNKLNDVTDYRLNLKKMVLACLIAQFPTQILFIMVSSKMDTLEDNLFLTAYGKQHANEINKNEKINIENLSNLIENDTK